MTPRIWPGWRLAPKPTSRSASRSTSVERSRTARHDYTAQMRLNAYLARAGVASRRKADELIKAGRVRVNGEPGRAEHLRRVARRRRGGRRAGRAAGARLRPPAQAGRRRHDRERPAGPADRRRLVGHESRVVPVGRLDVDTTGALLLTNDGPLAHRLAHPRYGVEKVYEVETWREPTDEALRRLARRGRAGGRPHVTRARAPPRRGPLRARPARGPQPPGAAHVRGGRPPRAAPAPQRLRGARRRRPRAGRVAGAHARARSSGSEEAARLALDEAHPVEHRLERRLRRLARLLGARARAAAAARPGRRAARGSAPGPARAPRRRPRRRPS